MRGQSEAPRFYSRHAMTIWALVIVYKLQDEYVTRMANVDRSDFLERLFGGGSFRPVGVLINPPEPAGGENA